MNLKDIIPMDLSAPEEQTLTALFRAMIMRANFTPGLRHVMGWRGLSDCSGPRGAAWTAKIKGHEGVFGFAFDGFDQAANSMIATIRLHYFPHPDEDLLDQTSVHAGMLAQQPGYVDRIRRFTRHEDLQVLFNIGLIRFGLDALRQAVHLELECATRQQVMAVDGLKAQGENGPLQVVAPGAFDQDFPAWATSRALFEVLAASAALCLGHPATSAARSRKPATFVLYDAKGNHWRETADELFLERLRLDWGGELRSGGLGRDEGFNEVYRWREGMPLPEELEDAVFWQAHRLGDFKSVDKTILGIDDRPQLIVLTGFLGSGKTSFLRGFLEYQEQMNRFAAVIQNEIGETGLDGKLLDREFAVTEIDEGCVCCSLAGNVKTAIHQIMGSFHPDSIVLETTGLANPLNLLDEIGELEDLVRFDSVTCVVDASNIEVCLRDFKVAREQIAAADIILLNKIDLVAKDELARLSSMIRAINGNAPLVETVNGDVSPALLYGSELFDHETAARHETPAGISGHAHTHGQDGVASVKVELNIPMDKERFLERVRALPPSVFRAKGVVSLAGHDNQAVLQYVAGRYEISEHRSPKPVQPFVVLIGKELAGTNWSQFFENGGATTKAAAAGG